MNFNEQVLIFQCCALNLRCQKVRGLETSIGVIPVRSFYCTGTIQVPVTTFKPYTSRYFINEVQCLVTKLID